MQFKSIVAVCVLLACVLANPTPAEQPKDGKKEEAPKEEMIIKADFTAKDVRAVKDCAKLSAKQVNVLTDKKACSGFTAKCLGAFDVKDVDSTCLDNVPSKEWTNFSKETCTQITDSSPATLVVSVENLKTILSKVDLTKLSAGFTGYVVRQEELLETIFNTEDAQVLQAFFTADNLAAIDASHYRRFGKSFISTLDEKAFSEVSAQQLALIPASGFEGFTAKQWAAVKPAAFAGLTKRQAEKLPSECWNAMTQAQITAFGTKVATVQAQSQTVKGPGKVLNQRQFKENHPCNAALAAKMDEKQAKLFKEQCKEVEAFKVNGAFTLTASIGASVAILAAALVPAIL